MKNRLSIAILFLIMSVNQMCSLVRTSDKEELINFFESEFMRRVPSDLFEVRSTERFDILLQKRDTYSDRYNYKNKNVFGVKSEDGTSNLKYDYMFSTSDVEALSHLDYISEIAKYFKSDTTHISTIWMNSDTLSVIISRRRKDEYIKYKVFEVEFMRDNFAFKRAINSEDVFLPSK